MPLPPPSERELVHTRRIECRGYRRDDGLWDIEGSLIDTRTSEMQTFGRGRIAPGEHLHEMWLRVHGLGVDRPDPQIGVDRHAQP
ncbi:MAG: DUF2889 domain-containing protein, partial [Gammaproteobacteria bacterium]|nr:DUF2889 domain-containing protein [Gammaproteobacteria bacterium]